LSGSIDRPLGGLRVLDLVQGSLAPLTRYLAELGARVDRVDLEIEPDPEADLAANAGKQRHPASLDGAGRQALIDQADAIVVSRGVSLDVEALRAARPRLVIMTVSDFGGDTPIADWRASDPILHALSGELSRSGIRGERPLLPPGQLAMQCAAAQGAYALVVALYHALRTGGGDHLDFSALDGAVQALDPGYGVSGSATMGKPANLLSRDRPPKGFQYPILPCADGHVRLCLLAKRQWRGMFRWMGEPAEFASPEFDHMTTRYKSPRLLPAIAAFFAERPRAVLEAEGQAFGVPIASVLTLEEFIASDHVAAREAVTTVSAGNSGVALPNGVVTIDGERMGVDGPMARAAWPAAPSAPPGARAFEGLKVLDLGVIVVGAEQGRLLGDQGADVVKVESRAYPDGNRQSYLSYGLSVSFAAGHRNKRSLGLNLRAPEGRALFLDLAAQADVILSNFKPGTLEGLGLAYEDVAAVNPRIVMADSSAFGATGPWSGRMGYGPLVRAATGLTLAWRYPEDPEGFSDSVTIYPDHVAARIGAMAVTALLIRRLRTGRGGTASIAQSEVMLGHFAADVARLSRCKPVGAAPDWPWSAYPAKGQDEWCVITVRGQAQWDALRQVIGLEGDELLNTAAGRLAARATIDAAIEAWLAAYTPLEASSLLQAAGAPAAPMLRVADLPTFAYFDARRFYRVEAHPYLLESVIAERRHVSSLAVADACAGAAPLTGEHSQAIVAQWLGLPAARIEALIDAEILEPVEAAVLAAATAAVASMEIKQTIDGN
jgi:crotonobetainyl-CoA:carnitine CoA-transferase CaiB-like acyl-CoA transferase